LVVIPRRQLHSESAIFSIDPKDPHLLGLLLVTLHISLYNFIKRRNFFRGGSFLANLPPAVG
jgi:hypothetical protein